MEIMTGEKGGVIRREKLGRINTNEKIEMQVGVVNGRKFDSNRF